MRDWKSPMARCPKFFLLLLAGLLSLVSPASWAGVERVAVVLGNEGVPYQEALTGFQGAAPFQFAVYRLHTASQPAQAVADKIISGKFTLVVLIGSEAFTIAPLLPHTVRLVYTMTLEETALPGHSSSGVLLEVDLADKFSRITRMFPDKKRIGFLFNPRSSSIQFMQARTLMGQYGLEVLPIDVETPAALADGLKKATAQKVDYLWMVIDENLARPESLRALIAYALEKRLLLIGFSKFQVKAGALAAFTADYTDIGAQTAVHVQKILSGQKTAKSETPRKIVVYINPIVRSKLDLPDLSRFQEVQEIK